MNNNLGTAIHYVRESINEEGGPAHVPPEQSNTLAALLPHQELWPENLWDEAYANLLCRLEQGSVI